MANKAIVNRLQNHLEDSYSIDHFEEKNECLCLKYFSNVWMLEQIDKFSKQMTKDVSFVSSQKKFCRRFINIFLSIVSYPWTYLFCGKSWAGGRGLEEQFQ